MNSASAAASSMSAGAVIGVSILNLSSISAIWSLVNQFQLFLLLLLTKTPFPDDVKAMLTGNNLMSFDLSFLPVIKLPVLKQFYSWVEAEQDNSYLLVIGIESQSGVNNNISLVFLLLCLVLCYPLVMSLKF